MLRKASLRFVPRKRGGSIPEGEARGGDFALSELPHPFPRFISQSKSKNFYLKLNIITILKTPNLFQIALYPSDGVDARVS